MLTFWFWHEIQKRFQEMLLAKRERHFILCLVRAVQPEKPLREQKEAECLQAITFLVWSGAHFGALHTELLLKEKNGIKVSHYVSTAVKRNSFSFQTKSTPLWPSALRDKEDTELVKCILVGWASADTYKRHWRRRRRMGREGRVRQDPNCQGNQTALQKHKGAINPRASCSRTDGTFYWHPQLVQPSPGWFSPDFQPTSLEGQTSRIKLSAVTLVGKTITRTHHQFSVISLE